jgi:putative membrane protein
MHYYGHDDGGSAAWWWMVPMMFVFVVAAAAVLWALLRSNHSPQVSQAGSPEDVLAHRFARGEIDSAEYHERLEVLRKPR